MGVVYMAEQTEPVKRRVALKIIKPGMDTRQVIARFEAERQALAMMDHPNIAKVLDAGTTDTGRPYFVMELVNGVPITEYCDEQHLTPRGAAGAVRPGLPGRAACPSKGDHPPRPQAVATCWSRVYDGRPVPKVIDFGVAKATTRQLTEKTLFTQFGQIVGTPVYMSPEQAEAEPAGHRHPQRHLFAGRVALRTADRRRRRLIRSDCAVAAFDEMLRIIREEEPPKPSTTAQHAVERCPRSLPIAASNPPSSARWFVASWTGS